MTPRRFTIWQCRDWCCEQRPHGTKWWNVGIAPGNYDSVPNWRAALTVAVSGCDAMDVIFCPAVTYRATRDTPEESCENEVEDYGDLCAEHDEDDRADELYDAYQDDLYEKRSCPDYYPDEEDQS